MPADLSEDMLLKPAQAATVLPGANTRVGSQNLAQRDTDSWAHAPEVLEALPGCRGARIHPLITN